MAQAYEKVVLNIIQTLEKYNFLILYPSLSSFENLNATEARTLFSSFIKEWNHGKLGDVFYKGNFI